MRRGLRARLGPAASLAGGSGLAALVAYAAQPVLSRLYAPEAFGVADLFAAVVTVLVPVGSFRYEDALLLPEDDRDAAHLFWLASALTLAMAALLLVASLAPAVSRSFIGPWAWLLAPTLVVMRIVNLTSAWLTRRRRFGAMASSPVARSAVTTGWRLAGGLPALGASAASLIYSFIAGQAVAMAIQAAPLRREPPLRTRPRLSQMRRLAVRYRRFALLTTPAVLFNNLAGRLPVFLLAFYFSEAVVGQFGRVLLTLALPLSLIGQAAGRVFIPDAVEAHRQERLPAAAARFHDLLVWIGFYPALVLVVAGPELFAFVFGEVWREAGLYARWLSPWLFLASVCAPLTALFDVTERHQRDVLTSILQVALVALSVVLGAATGRPLVAVAALGAAGVIGRLVQLFALWRTGGLSLRALPGRYAPALVASAPGAAFLLVPGLSAAVLFGAAALGGLIYAWLGWRRVGPEKKEPPAHGDGS